MLNSKVLNSVTHPPKRVLSTTVKSQPSAYMKSDFTLFPKSNLNSIVKFNGFFILGAVTVKMIYSEFKSQIKHEKFMEDINLSIDHEKEQVENNKISLNEIKMINKDSLEMLRKYESVH